MLVALIVSSSFAQTFRVATLTGFVNDKSSGESLIGASVSVTGTVSGKRIKMGAFTNDHGLFVIPGVPVGEDTLVVGYAGYTQLDTTIAVAERPAGPLRFYLAQSWYKTGEVVVTGHRMSPGQKAFDRQISTMNLTAQQVNAMPKVIEPDLFRALENTPGIVALSDYSSAIYVRGGTPDQNLYLIDGAQIYDPEHAFGIFSTFNTDAIKQVNVIKGGFGPQYDDRLSSVIDVLDKEGNRHRFQGTLNVSLLAANVTAEMPLGPLGSMSGSLRRTYLDQVYGRFVEDFPPYYFFDGNLKAYLQLTDKDVLAVSAFNSGDNLTYSTDHVADNQDRNLVLRWGNTVGSVNWRHILGDRLASSLYVTYSGFFSDLVVKVKPANSTELNHLGDFTVRDALTYYASDRMTLDVGAEYKKVAVLYTDDVGYGAVRLSTNSSESSAYANLDWRPDPVWQIDAGLRTELFRSDTTYAHIDPRLTVKYRLSENSALKFAAGIYHQYMNAVQRPLLTSIWFSSDKYIHDSQSEHLILGYEYQIGGIFDFETEAYYKNYGNIYASDYNLVAQILPPGHGINEEASSSRLFTRGDGNSVGLEILLRRDIGALNGWLSYSLSKTSITLDGMNQGNSFEPQWNRTSVVNVVLNANINDIFAGRWSERPPRNSPYWQLSFNFIFASGQPITIPSSIYFVNLFPAWDGYSRPGGGTPAYQFYPGPTDSYKLPDYARLDVSLTCQIGFGSWSLSPYLQVINAGFRKNVWFIYFSPDYYHGRMTPRTFHVIQFPILPSIGISAKF